MKHYCSFSEAIRDGAKLSAQTDGRLESASGATCALGAGLKAMGLRYISTALAGERLAEIYPYLAISTHCPGCAYFGQFDQVIICLNDEHRWTREEIADWLESEEEKLGYVTITESVESESLVTLGTLGVTG